MAPEPLHSRFPDVPRWATVWFPLALLVAIFAFRLADTERLYFALWIDSERGIVENGTVAVLVLATLFLGVAWRWRSRLPDGRLGAWLILCMLACVVYAGEEAGWGQHWFGWDAPEFFAEYNRKPETSFHNFTEYLTHRLPKTILTIGIVALGLVAPLWMRRKGITLDPATNWRYWFLPTGACVPMAWFVVATRAYERILVWTHLKGDSLLFEMSFKEVHELTLAGFLLVYSWSFWRRLRFAATLWAASGRPSGGEIER